ncbi:hypothetical protein RKE29_09590, partial [Streptomyces sp. B1866]|uniref:hypothetical protein n=1 Tax=Streptomyces sp. B1866 TaxID=3075431 RepID=UPI00288C8384
MTRDPGRADGADRRGPRDLDWQQFADALWLAACRTRSDHGAGGPAQAPPPREPPAEEAAGCPDPGAGRPARCAEEPP